MFEHLSDRLRQTVKRVRGRARITEENVKDTLREVRIALLEADVALPVVKTFIAQVQERAVGRDVIGSLTPGQAVIKVVHEELISLMGQKSEGLALQVRPPVPILLAGLQGSGKTTTVIKLAKWLTQKQKKRVLVASADIYRPAAIQQLEKLAGDAGIDFFSSSSTSPLDIASAALTQARNASFDILIMDTAGRLHVDDSMMQEIREIHARLQPVETLFVADSMTGQDAVNSASAFNDALALTGVILTKTDGDARGGAALSIRHVTGQPIKFLGTGEQIDALEVFHPDRLASRILGMGDVLSLVERVEEKVDKTKAEKLAKKLTTGKRFDLTDFRDQIQQMEKMGGISSMLDKLPGLDGVPSHVVNQVDDRQFKRVVAIVDSMTPQERRHPAIIKGSRKRRIAGGSGTQIQDVNRLLKQFTQMQKMMKKMRKRGGMNQLLAGMKGKLPGAPF
ncbi:MAG: signal recognition particle protein [Arenicellales bacterium]|nr:signal recognition particle protein [Arenicellales bacterium]